MWQGYTTALPVLMLISFVNACYLQSVTAYMHRGPLASY